MMRYRLLLAAFVCAFLGGEGGVSAQNGATDYLKDLQPYHPHQQVSGTIRVWGNDQVQGLMQEWQAGLSKVQPNLHFQSTLPGTEAAMAGLYANIADLVFVGREPYPPEIHAFEERFGYAPLEVRFTSGSYAAPDKDFSLMVFVHKNNPLQHLTMGQLALVFGCGCDAAGKPLLTWGQLGLTGAWATQPVHVYGYTLETGMSIFFQHVVLHDSQRWNSTMKMFDNGYHPDGKVINAGVYVLQALARDPDGIAYANLFYASPGVKTIALGKNSNGPFIAPTPKTTWLREYPLTRYSTVFLNRKPGQPIDPKLREFLLYILSKEGMAAVVHHAYLPLDEKSTAEERRKLR